jgi:hypothetical protein
MPHRRRFDRSPPNVDASGHLENGQEILKRELGEEAGGAAVELLGALRMQQKDQITPVDLGGLFYVKVADRYSKAVSQKHLSLAEFADILGRTVPDVAEVKSLAIVCLPPPDTLPKPSANDPEASEALSDHLKKNWCALPASIAKEEEKAQKAARRTQQGIVRMLVKVFTARGHFGNPFPDALGAPINLRFR